MKVLRTRFALVSMLLLAACSNPPGSNSAAGTKAEAAETALIPLTIKGATASHQFRVEIARTREEQDRGLMYRESLPADGGMIFPKSPPDHASFWMKNTLLPLDMIFIRPDGIIARIEAETIPYSLNPIPSGEPVSAVLEIAGGEAARRGIAAGDRVIWDDPKD